MSHSNILDASDTVLIIVDIQDPLLKAIHEADRVIANTKKLIEAAKVLSIPIIVTLQYAEKWGDMTAELTDMVPHTDRVNKMTFSCFGGVCFPSMLQETMRGQVLICGIETHVCVNQTAHDMLAKGYSVHVVRDAVSSRTPENWTAGLEKMRDSGCIITSTEMAVFELLQDASKAEFRQLLPLFK